ncbi:MAG: hypothetical protein AAGH71_04290 [Planctomycetota bacterium]
MPTTLPRTIAGRIAFYRERIAAWAADPAAIGLTPATVDAVADAVERAEAAAERAEASRQRTKNDTTLQREALRKLNDIGSVAIAGIRAHADLSDDSLAVFGAAKLTPTKTSGPPKPAPAAARNPSATLLTSGAVRLAWEGTTANGTFYDVYRQLDRRLDGQQHAQLYRSAGSGSDPGVAAFTLIGSSATRSFDDGTVPAGTPRASYFVIARRGPLIGPMSQTAVIRFGMPTRSLARTVRRAA